MLRLLDLTLLVSIAATSVADADPAMRLPDLKNLTAADMWPNEASFANIARLRARGAKGEFVLRTRFTEADLDNLSMSEQSYFNAAASLKHPKSEASNWMISGDALALERQYCRSGPTPADAAMILKIGDLESLHPPGFSSADRQCYRAASQSNAALARQPAPMPADIQKYVRLEESCAHWEGEEAYDAERAAEIKRNLRGCDAMPPMEQSLRQKYRGDKAILSAIDEAAIGESQ